MSRAPIPNLPILSVSFAQARSSMNTMYMYVGHFEMKLPNVNTYLVQDTKIPAIRYFVAKLHCSCVHAIQRAKCCRYHLWTKYFFRFDLKCVGGP